LTRAGRPERHERATIFIFGIDSRTLSRLIPSQSNLSFEHYNELGAG
jgi:hypothetical protein